MINDQYCVISSDSNQSFSCTAHIKVFTTHVKRNVNEKYAYRLRVCVSDSTGNHSSMSYKHKLYVLKSAYGFKMFFLDPELDSSRPTEEKNRTSSGSHISEMLLW